MAQRYGTDVSLELLARVIARHWRAIAGGALVGAAAAVAVAWIRPARYETSSTILPVSSRVNTDLAGLAAQVGFMLPTGGGEQNPELYAYLLKSRPILRQLAERSYVSSPSAGAQRLHVIWQIDADNPRAVTQEVVERLARSIESGVVRQAGIVATKVTTTSPALSLQIHQALLELVENVNRRTRRTQAAAERQFAEQRLAEIAEELRTAEDRLANFLERNREFGTPSLRFEEERLRRVVSLQQQLYVSMAQALEQARLEEARDTPLFSVIEEPLLPARALARKFVLYAIGGGVLAALGMSVALVARAMSWSAWLGELPPERSSASHLDEPIA